MEWRDTNGTQRQPNTLSGPAFKIPVSKAVQRVWMASPDLVAGAPMPLAVEQSGNELTIRLPSLKYWNMVAGGGFAIRIVER